MLSNLRLVLLFAVVAFAAPLFAQPQIQLLDFASGFIRPVDIAHCGDSRLFIVEQRGLIWIVDSLGNKSTEPFLDIDARVRSVQNEQGLLGLAFDPDYATNGYFYVYYTREPDYDTHVSRFSRDAVNPNKADPNSELILLYEDQPFTNHNGGCMKFGPDGYLYISLGDGGSANDPQNNGQNKNTFLGKILRIEVGQPGQTYTVPASNPFVNNPAYKPEIWSLGWRNPWRFSFDRLTGDMWVADVGQSAREEICFEPAGAGGRNYGWRCYEGFNNFNTTGCQPPGIYTRPVYDYPNPTMGCSVTGGFVYRGQQFPDLYGYYLFTDYCSGRWWASRRSSDSTFNTQLLVDLANNQYSSLGEDSKGELYVASLSAGKIQRITELCSAFQLSADITPASCEGALNGIIDLNITGGTGNISFVWSPNANGQTDSLVVYLDPGEYVVTATNGNGCVRTTTFMVTASVNLPEPMLNVAPGDTLPPLCEGESLELTTQTPPVDAVVEWYRDGELIPGVNGPSLTVTTGGVYSALFTDGACDSERSPEIPVTVLNAVLSPVIEVSTGQPVLCPDATATLSALAPPAGVSMEWYLDGVLIPGADQFSLEVNEPGSYAALYTNGVCASDLSDPLLVTNATIPDAPQISLAAGQTILCPGASATLQASAAPAGYTYQWFRNDVLLQGVTSQEYVVNYDEAGNYTVALEGLCGPIPSTTFLLAAETATPFAILVNGDTLNAGIWNSYQWLFNGVPIPGATEAIYVAEESGWYECQVQSVNNCTYEAGVQIVVIQTKLPQSVRTFNLAPNPTDGLFVLRMELQQSKEILLSLTDGTQREIFRQTLQGQSIEKTIDLRGLPSGVYLLQVQIGKDAFTRRVVKR